MPVPPTATGQLSVVTKGFAVSPDTVTTVLHERLGSTSGATVAAWTGMSLTIWATVSTASFHKTMRIDASTIEAAFIIGGAICSFMSVVTTIRWLAHRKKASPSSIVEEIQRRAGQAGR